MKIYIFGCPGSGKTTLGKRLAKEHSLDFFEIDRLFEGIENIEQREKIIKEILGKHPDNRIFEGMYRQDWMNQILQKCDQIIILKYSKYKIRFRLFLRMIKNFLGIEKTILKSGGRTNRTLFVYLWKFVDEYQTQKREQTFVARVKSLGKEKNIVWE